MGCNQSVHLSPNKANDNAPDDSRSTPSWGKFLLDDIQKDCILQTWPVLTGHLIENGTLVFNHIFRKRPEVKLLFPFRHVSGQELWEHPVFRAHSLHFMQAIGTAVDNVDELDTKLSPALLDLGAQHSRTKGFGVEYFELFTQALIMVWQERLGPQFTAEVRSAWEKMFIFILMTLREGYQLECDRSTT